MVFETIIVGFVCIAISIILAVGGIIGIGTWKSISLGLAEIKESGQNVRERINVRADMAYDPGDDGGDAAGGISELDSIARLLNYESAAAALSDPALIAKVSKIMGGKE